MWVGTRESAISAMMGMATTYDRINEIIITLVGWVFQTLDEEDEDPHAKKVTRNFHVDKLATTQLSQQ